MKNRSLTPGSVPNNQVSVQNGGYIGEPRPRESYDAGYVDAEYHTVDSEKDFRDYISIILRRKKTIIIIAAIVFIGAVIYTSTLPKVYLSQATLEIEKESGTSLTNIGDMLSAGGSGGNEAEMFATQIGIVTNRTTAQDLITRMNLAESPEFQPLPSFLDSAIDWVKHTVGSLVGIEPGGAPDPVVAKEGQIKA